MEYYFIFILFINIIIIISLYFIYRKSKICKNQDYYLSYIHNSNKTTTIDNSFSNHNHNHNEKKYVTKQQDDKLFIITNAIIDCSYLLYFLKKNEKINYICWTNQFDLNWTIFEKSRDTFMTLLFYQSNKTFSKQFILIQKCFFSIEILLFLSSSFQNKNWNLFWITLLNDHLIKKKKTSTSTILYSSFFTIYFDQISDQLETYKYIFYPSFQSYNKHNLIQCWIDYGTNVDFLNNCYQSALKYYHNQYIIFSDFDMKQFIRTYYNKQVLYQYDNIIPSAFKSDFFRYLYLYQFGGLYIDISMTHYLNLYDYFSSVFPSKYSFISAIDNHHSTNIYNAFIMCIPKHPFLKECIDQILELKKTDTKKCLYYTGPGLLGNVIKNLKTKYPNYYLLTHDSPYIYDDKKKILATKLIDKSKKIGSKMYSESNKHHYSDHCLIHKILYN
jgi:mannosyltransferase OCH1-like enzyme